jgi:hypothetical protein
MDSFALSGIATLKMPCFALEASYLRRRSHPARKAGQKKWKKFLRFYTVTIKVTVWQ